jgi:ATP-dependent DNA ligase
MRVLQRRDFVIGGYTPAGRNFGAILIGDYEARALKYVAKVHGGFTPAMLCSSASMGSRQKRAPSRTYPRRGAVSGAKD